MPKRAYQNFGFCRFYAQKSKKIETFSTPFSKNGDEKFFFFQNCERKVCQAECELLLCRRSKNASTNTLWLIGQKLTTPFFVGEPTLWKLWGPKKNFRNQSSQTVRGFYSVLVVLSNLHSGVLVFFWVFHSVICLQFRHTRVCSKMQSWFTKNFFSTLTKNYFGRKNLTFL